MRVQVLYFAILRERLGLSEEHIDLRDAGTVGNALAQLERRHPTMAGWSGRVQIAVNQRMVPITHELRDGDEMALIPPVSGGADPRRIAVIDHPLSLDEVVASVCGPRHGALVTFTGQVRSHGQLPEVVRLEYEAYVAMAEAVLKAIADELEAESPGVRVAIHHRTGVLDVGQPAVVIAAAAAHRAEAFTACRDAIERLKQRAPIWKKEVGPDGAVWIGSGP